MNNREKIICSKYDILLTKNDENDENMYNIKFKIKNNFNIDKIINEKLYNLIGLLNKDIIEKVEIVDKISENELNILYIFNRFGEEVGISKKHLFMKCFIKKDTNKIEFIGSSIPYNNSIDTDAIIYENGCLTITGFQTTELSIDYSFKITIDEDLPLYMTNLIGLLIKKLLYNFKVFIDNMQENILDNI